jgi:predicted phosphodiesterase
MHPDGSARKTSETNMKTIAILSDVHSNLEAFTAVLEYIHKLGIDTIYSLGDTVGYGPDPVECTHLAAAHCPVRLMGNHEYAMRFPDQLQFNPSAKIATDWTLKKLKEANIFDLATDLQTSLLQKDILYVHGSVRCAITDYVFSEDSHGYSNFDPIVETLEKEFVRFRLCFVGHNHLPFLATTEGFLYPHDDINEFYVVGQKLYISVGSVGQPRDRNPRASFVTFNGEIVKYHRVEYPVEITAKKIRKSGLPENLADRLLLGE